MLKEYAITISRVVKLADLVLFVAAGFCAYFLRFHNLHFDTHYFMTLLLAALLMIPVFSLFSIYRPLRGQSVVEELGLLFVANATVMLLLATIIFFTKTGVSFSRLWFFIWFILSFIALASFRVLLRNFLAMMRKRGWNQRHVALIGQQTMVAEILKRTRTAAWSGFNVAHYFIDDAEGEVLLEQKQAKKTPTALAATLSHLSVDEVWLGFPLSAECRVREIIDDLRGCVVTIRLFPDLFGMSLINHSTDNILGLSAINIVSSPMVGINRVIKAFEDRILALLILAIISPLLLLIAVLVKFTSKGPVFYSQERKGWNGKSFNMLKFRSMRQNAEENTGAVWARKNDDRTTRIGKLLRKTSLDELPQFINVLKGDMSIVGPRPERPIFVDRFKNEIPNYMKKHLVKAGITGWAQVNGWRGDTSIDKRIECDIYYIENWSLWFDLKIIFLTFFNGFINKNAY